MGSRVLLLMTVTWTPSMVMSEGPELLMRKLHWNIQSMGSSVLLLLLLLLPSPGPSGGAICAPLIVTAMVVLASGWHASVAAAACGCCEARNVACCLCSCVVSPSSCVKLLAATALLLLANPVGVVEVEVNIREEKCAAVKARCQPALKSGLSSCCWLCQPRPHTRYRTAGAQGFHANMCAATVQDRSCSAYETHLSRGSQAAGWKACWSVASCWQALQVA